jgi:hypothetical protein
MSIRECDLLFLQLPAQSVSMDAQQIRGTTQVPPSRCQRSPDTVTLEDVEWLELATVTLAPTIARPAIV